MVARMRKIAHITARLSQIGLMHAIAVHHAAIKPIKHFKVTQLSNMPRSQIIIFCPITQGRIVGGNLWVLVAHQALANNARGPNGHATLRPKPGLGLGEYPQPPSQGLQTRGVYRVRHSIARVGKPVSFINAANQGKRTYTLLQ